MNKLKKLFNYIEDNSQCKYRPVINVERDYLYLMDNCGNKIFYDEIDDVFIIKCRIKCIKDDNVITYLTNPIIMDLKAKTKRDVLAIINSNI
jgi:hypothetical protein